MTIENEAVKVLVITPYCAAGWQKMKRLMLDSLRFESLSTNVICSTMNAHIHCQRE